jgi:hypothetical protein
MSVGLLLAACGGESSDDGPVTQPSSPAVTASDCVVRLHGKSESGAATSVDGNGVARVAPNGNERDGNGYKWIYFPDESYVAARTIVTDAIARIGCERVVLGGFSNGAAFAAKLYCSGDDLGAPIVGVVIDDPVPDNGAAGCAPLDQAPVTVFWTGALAETAQPGWECDEGGWICDGGTTVGIERFAADLGATITASPFTDHIANVDAPEWTAFD